MTMTTPDRRFVPTDWAGQVTWFGNWDKQMTLVGGTLGYSAAELVRIHDDFLMLKFLHDAMMAIEAFDDAATNNRRIMSRGKVGEPTPAFPANTALALPATTEPVPPGIWQRNNEDVRRVREAPAFTDETAGLLQIIPIEVQGIGEAETQPSLKITTEPGYNVKITGKMLGRSALRIDYQRKGSDAWPLAGFLTRLPGEIVITPQTPGQPESGRLRGVFIEDSKEYGQFSPEYPITVS